MKLRRTSSLYSPRAAPFTGPLSSLLREQHLIQLIRSIAVHLFSHMGIDIEGRADIAVAQPALDGLDVDAMLDHQGSRCMAEVVQPEVRKMVSA